MHCGFSVFIGAGSLALILYSGLVFSPCWVTGGDRRHASGERASWSASRSCEGCLPSLRSWLSVTWEPAPPAGCWLGSECQGRLRVRSVANSWWFWTPGLCWCLDRAFVLYHRWWLSSWLCYRIIGVMIYEGQMLCSKPFKGHLDGKCWRRCKKWWKWIWV